MIPVIPLPAEAKQYPVFYESADDQHRRETRALFWLAAQTTGAILEIGTHNGIKAMELARTFSDRKVITVDYTGTYPTMALEQLSEQPSRDYFGSRCRDLANVTCLDTNSRTLNYLTLERLVGGPIGFIFIDGDHSDHGVRADTNLALNYAAMSRQALIIAWHDYTDYPEHPWIGVTRVLNSIVLAAKLPLTEIQDTRTAFAEFNV